ncbi:MAG TPA: type II secretion system protein GspJ [Verrucomicrobiota bacterium]|nr:type II secretion system protein GspJ [Verrucomicrobiota bacterium]HNU50546.1 type II secretion system protein GspJ [Verrucomicrobiota bacterium]
MNARRPFAVRGLPAEPAFTLIEVLFATTAFAIILVAVHGVFFNAIRLRDRTTQSLDAALPVQRALAYLQRDLANLVPPGGTLFGALQTTPTTASTNADSLITAGSSEVRSGAQQVSPDLYTAVGVLGDDLPWAEVQRVTYYLMSPTNQTAVGLDLVRSVTRNLLPPNQEEWTEERLLSGVEDVRFFFYDGTQWLETWDSTTEETPLPRAVRVELTRSPEAVGLQTPIPTELVVPVMVVVQTNATAEAEGSESTSGGGSSGGGGGGGGNPGGTGGGR